MLRINNLTCARNENILFSNVTVAINPGEVLQINGANGIGKTTLLRTIAGLLRAQAGKIEYGEMDICYIGHKSGLHPDLTVQQNLEFLHMLDNNGASTKVDQALTYFSVQNKKQIKCGELSAGQSQRVSLTRLLFTKAKLWLLDEPLANLDLQAVALLLALCKRHLSSDGLLVIATHNPLNLNEHPLHELQLQNYV